MIDVLDFKVNEKYFITIEHPLNKQLIDLRVRIHEIIPKLNPNSVDYIAISNLPSSKNFNKELRLEINSICHIPLLLIKKKESLHKILNKVFIDDIIFLINEYI